jgi:NADH-quinone oxidoreductase subunit H
VLFAVFFLAEYANILLLCHLASLLLLGGWTLPDLYVFIKIFNLPLYNHINHCFIIFRDNHPYLLWIYHTFIYTSKVYLYLFAFVWVRATLPRYRYDQLMRLGWKVFVPLTIGLVLISAALIWIFDGGLPPGGFIYIDLE